MGLAALGPRVASLLVLPHVEPLQQRLQVTTLAQGHRSDAQAVSARQHCSDSGIGIPQTPCLARASIWSSLVGCSLSVASLQRCHALTVIRHSASGCTGARAWAACTAACGPPGCQLAICCLEEHRLLCLLLRLPLPVLVRPPFRHSTGYFVLRLVSRLAELMSAP